MNDMDRNLSFGARYGAGSHHIVRPATPEEKAEADHTERVLSDIRTEHERHPELGWTAEHDDNHSIHELVDLAKQYAGKPESDRDEHYGLYSRGRLVQAASLLVAAIKSMDRRDD